MNFGGLAVGVSCGGALPECLEASHLGLDTAAQVVAGPAFPEGASEVPCGPEDVVAGGSCRPILFPGSSGRPVLRIGMIAVAWRSMIVA